MAWQDRGYNSAVNYGGNPFSHPLLKLIFGSVYIGTLFRTRIRIHASLLWYIGLSVAFAGSGYRENALIAAVMLFGLVFLHEFGHIFACRSVGGDADEMLLWLLGGLAFAGAPRRPWPQFVTVAGGPLVNVVIGGILYAVIYLAYHVMVPLNPLFPFYPQLIDSYFKDPSFRAFFGSATGHYVFWLFSTNWALLFFNLIPMFPLDGGQLLQAILWKPLGYVKAMKIACYAGMALSVLMGLFGLRFGAFFLLFIAFFSFFGSLQTLRLLKMTGDLEEREPYDLSAAWEQPDRRAPPRKRRKKKWFRAARKLASREQAEQAKIDAILAKVKERGLHSLTWWEKRALKKATERQRQQDLAERY